MKTVLVRNSNWWGKAGRGQRERGRLPAHQAGRPRALAALLSGEVDFVLDPPPQDIARLKKDAKIKVVEGNENRTIFFGFDQWRDELQYSRR